MAKYSDRRKLGPSQLVPFQVDEAPKARHARREQVAHNCEGEVHTLCSTLGVTLRVLNQGVYWQFRKGKWLWEWWPSSAKLVRNQQWHDGLHAHDYEQVMQVIRKDLGEHDKGKT